MYREGHNRHTVRLADYLPPAFLVDHTRLWFSLHPDKTTVKATLTMRRNPAFPADQAQPQDCVLDGEALTLVSVALDGHALKPDEYRCDAVSLTVFNVPDAFELETEVAIFPEQNTALEGLYLSKGMYCTQCEAEGFRRITYFPDRPDVLSRFTVTIDADQASYPLLLSNGNPVASSQQGSRHQVTWEDPFPKPCYLFALVAGELACLEDTYTTGSGREVSLRIYAEPRDLDKLDHAMLSLKNAMRWDEQVYGREYDLDIYMIVAVSHFNMGAMENKGLNIFNTSCVLAHPATTTDAGFQRVEVVVAHEYFHNWSGNRVTCRDWFQLSLKEGFTVFRDQEFSADMNSRAVKRVEDVDMLRAFQFPEDQGPMAHPVRPDHYVKIDNFYTVTIYEKGAELVRMQYNLLGPQLFRKATDLYFDRFDGQAVTTDDFVDCMAEASGLDLSAFRRWYAQAGTPIVDVEDHWDAVQQRYTLTLRQHTPDTPGQTNKKPVPVPVTLALLGHSGQALAITPEGETEQVLLLDQAEQHWVFDLPEKPVPSLLRGFSAPVELHRDYHPDELAHLLAYDTDGYIRWDAAQRLYQHAVEELLRGAAEDVVIEPLLAVMEKVIARADEDPAQAAMLLTLPSEVVIGDRMTVIDPQAIHHARNVLLREVGRALAPAWQRLVEHFDTKGVYRPVAEDMGRRSLRHRALHWLAAAQVPGVTEQLQRLYREANNMTDQLGALKALVWHGLPEADQVLADFYHQWQDEALVIDQWFMLQAVSTQGDAVARVQQLLAHPEFDMKTPNRVRAVLGAFAGQNPAGFHREEGEGYALMAEQLAQLDRINPQIAARMANLFARWNKYTPVYREQIRQQMVNLLSGDLSDNTREVLERCMAVQA